MAKVVPDPFDDLFIDELDVFHDMEVRALIVETLKPYLSIDGTKIVWTERAELMTGYKMLLAVMIVFRVLQVRGLIDDLPSITRIEREMLSREMTRHNLKTLIDQGIVRVHGYGYELKASRVKDACGEIRPDY